MAHSDTPNDRQGRDGTTALAAKVSGTSPAGEIRVRGTVPGNSRPEKYVASRAAIASADKDRAGCVRTGVWGPQLADRWLV